MRGVKAMLDAVLAALYGVETKRLNEQVKRHRARFPDDFMFQLTQDECAILRSQNATSRWGGRRTLPYAFTELGITIMRTFVELRQWQTETTQLPTELQRLQLKYDDQFQAVFEVLDPIEASRRPIGFIWPKEEP